MNKKAFTLIELLISIIIIGVIAVIVIPNVSNMIKNSKKGSFESSAKSIARKVKVEYASGNISGTQVNCMSSKYKTNDGNYLSCTANIYINDKDAVVSVDVVGTNNYAGLTIIGAKEDMAHAFENNNTTSLKTTILNTVAGKDINVNKYAGNGLYRWGSEYIYRGGITKTNANGLATADYASDTDSGTDVSNFIKVPWETYTAGETCTSTSNKCWRIMSINPDSSITIVRDKNEPNQIFDNTYNSSTSAAYGYNDLLSNIPTSGHPEEYRAISAMYNRLYGSSGYELNNIIKYINLLKPTDTCLNKVNNYAGVNNPSYSSTTAVIDTCNVVGKTSTVAVEPLKNKYVRLPYLEEYLNASLETTCTTDYQYQCRSQNFMYNKAYYWLINGFATSSWFVRRVAVAGQASYGNASDTYYVRPVVNLKSSVLILTGDTGAANDPYVIKW